MIKYVQGTLLSVSLSLQLRDQSRDLGGCVLLHHTFRSGPLTLADPEKTTNATKTTPD